MKQRILKDKSWSIGIAALSLFSGLLTLWNLQDVSRSEYYASIAKSMSINLGNFFFGAIDPAGTVTLDKIPGSYWIPAIFAKLFGFSTWSITAPNALATIILVISVATTAKMLFGRTAGFMAGAIVATTPIVIAVSRSNQPQSFFLLTLALAAHFAAKALIGNSRKYLIISGAWIALAFHTYMLQAWALWPALIIAWFFTQESLGKKVLDLLIAGATSLALSLTWIVIVLLIPASHRPYIGGTYNNNPFEMVFGYNGLGRFTATTSALSSATDDPTFRSFTPPFGGEAGIGRIFSTAVAGQIAWVIPVAIASIVILFLLRVSKPLIIFLILWLVTFFAMFSAVAGIHQFYTSSLALPVALLSAGAIALSIEAGRKEFIFTILGTAGLSSFFISSHYDGYLGWAAYLQLAVAFVSAGVVLSNNEKFRIALIPSLVLLGVILTPAAWSVDSHNYTNSINPVAGAESFNGMKGGPSGMGAPGGVQDGARPSGMQNGGRPPIAQDGARPPGAPNGIRPPGMQDGARPDQAPTQSGGIGGAPVNGFGEQDNSEMISYLAKNRNGAKFLLATFGAQSAASYITATGENVLPIGGFDGQDPTPTLEKFKAMVQAGEIRYVLASNGDGDKKGNTQASNEISTWVSSNCSIDSNSPSSSLYLCTAR